MANRWGNNGNSDRLYFLGLHNRCGRWLQREIKRHLLLGRKAMTNLDSTLKSRDLTLPTEVHIVKAMVFPVVMYGCEGWIIKKAEHRRIDAFKLWCWRRLLRVPWTARRSNQSKPMAVSFQCMTKSTTNKKKIQKKKKGNQHWIFIGRNDAEAETPEASATWCREVTHWKRALCWERLKAKGEMGGRGWDG